MDYRGYVHGMDHVLAVMSVIRYRQSIKTRPNTATCIVTRCVFMQNIRFATVLCYGKLGDGKVSWEAYMDTHSCFS